MNSNLGKNIYHESPHIVIQKSLHLIIENSVIQNNPSISQDSLMQRKITYDIEKTGQKVKIWSKNKRYKNVMMDKISGRRIYIIVNLIPPVPSY